MRLDPTLHFVLADTEPGERLRGPLNTLLGPLFDSAKLGSVPCGEKVRAAVAVHRQHEIALGRERREYGLCDCRHRSARH